MDKNLLSNTFCISAEKIGMNHALNTEIAMSKAYLYFHDNTEVFKCSKDDRTLYIIGYILDIRDGNLNIGNISDNLLDSFSKDDDTFYNELKFLNGRYVLIFDTPDDTSIYTDATSMRPIYQWEMQIFGSHEILVKEIVETEKNIKLEKFTHFMNGFLDYSNIKRIFKFNPNLYFSFKDSDFTRYFPRNNFKEQELDTVLENTKPYYLPQVDWIKNNYEDIYLSVTGGIDSKVSMAVTKSLQNKQKYFTYMKNITRDDVNSNDSAKRIYARDKFIVDQLVDSFNLNHTLYYFKDYKMPKSYLEKMKTHVSSHHSYVLSYMMDKEFNKNSLHIKSTLYEFAKIPYLEDFHRSIKNNDMVKVLKNWAPAKTKSNFKFLFRLYSDAFKRNKMRGIIDQGYNLPLMIYWEFRMGNWHGNITQETDKTSETFIFVNNRYMIDQLQTLKVEDRKNKGYLYGIIDEFWPALNYYTPNELSTLKDKNENLKQIVNEKDEELEALRNYKREIETGIEKLEISETDVFPLLNKNKNTKRIAQDAAKNKIIPFPGFESTTYDENYWYTDKTAKYGASYQLYIQSLRVCAELLNHYIETKMEKYFLKAEEIIKAWVKFSKTDPEERMVWYDHPTANRVQVIIQYLYLAEENGFGYDEKLFADTLKQHAKVLSDDSIYNNNNHGLMMDRSLMVIGHVLKDDFLFNKGYYRAIDTFWYSFSAQGIHLENSPDYHNMVVRMYRDIEKYLNDYDGTSLGNNIKEYLSIAANYPRTLVKPDGQFPAIGDSGTKQNRLTKKYDNIYDFEAGISVLQHKSPKPLYLSFVCGYSSKVHKHKDDLSITLNYNGKDFIVDPGKFNYSKSKARNYITSKRSHSSFQLRDYDYAIKNENRFTRKIALKGHEENKFYSIVRGEHADYRGNKSVLKRTAVKFHEKPLILIIDTVELSGEEPLNFRQNFNLDAKVEVVEQNDKIRLQNGEETFCVRQILSGSTKRVVEGDLKIPTAINTIGFGKAEETKQVQYDKNSKDDTIFCTLLYDDEEIPEVDVKIEDGYMKVEIEGDEYTIII